MQLLNSFSGEFLRKELNGDYDLVMKIAHDYRNAGLTVLLTRGAHAELMKENFL
jgi:hypothetical protein